MRKMLKYFGNDVNATVAPALRFSASILALLALLACFKPGYFELALRLVWSVIMAPSALATLLVSVPTSALF